MGDNIASLFGGLKEKDRGIEISRDSSYRSILSISTPQTGRVDSSKDIINDIIEIETGRSPDFKQKKKKSKTLAKFQQIV